MSFYSILKNKNFLVLTLAFFLIFLGFNTAQSYFTSIYHTENSKAVSFISLILIYLSFGFFSFVSYKFTSRYGLKQSLILSSFAYLIFIILIFFKIEILLYIISIVLGLAAAILWAAQGAYLTSISNKREYGLASSLFLFSLPLGSLMGILITNIVLKRLNPIIIYPILSLFILLGAFLLFLLLDIKKKTKAPKFMEAIYFLKNKYAVNVSISMFVSYLLYGFILGSFPIKATDLFGIKELSSILIFFPLVALITTLVIGGIADKISYKITLIVGMCAGLLSLFLLFNNLTKTIFIASISLISFSVYTINPVSLSYIAANVNKKYLEFSSGLRWIASSFAIVISLLLGQFLNFNLIIWILIITIFTCFLIFVFNNKV